MIRPTDEACLRVRVGRPARPTAAVGRAYQGLHPDLKNDVCTPPHSSWMVKACLTLASKAAVHRSVRMIVEWSSFITVLHLPQRHPHLSPGGLLVGEVDCATAA